MDSRKERQLESTLTARYGRPVKVTQRLGDRISIVFEPTRDRGRVELVAAGAGAGWMVSDRGAASRLYGLDIDAVISRLAAFDNSLTRRDNEIITFSDGRSLAETIAEFADSIEFIPVLAGLFANDIAA